MHGEYCLKLRARHAGQDGLFDRGWLPSLSCLVHFLTMPIPDRCVRYVIDRNDGFQRCLTLRNSG